MGSAVDTCNVALSHLGNARRVASIDPPDGSVEADYCATFYPIALKELLEAADWTFARKRVALAPATTNESLVWTYAYAKPSDCLVPRRILTNDPTKFEQDSADFDTEGDVLYTNQAEAVLVYTRPVSDPTKFSSSFETALALLLAAHLAGPILKGTEGVNAKNGLRKMAADTAKSATSNDANKTSLSNMPFPSGLMARGGYAGSTSPSTDVNTYGTGYAIS